MLHFFFLLLCSCLFFSFSKGEEKNELNLLSNKYILQKKNNFEKKKMFAVEVKKEKEIKKHGVVRLFPKLKVSDHAQNMEKLEEFFEKDKLNNTEPWRNIEKEKKLAKMTCFAKQYCMQNNLGEVEEERLTYFLHECIRTNKIQKVKEIDYDKMKGTIKSIHGLHYDEDTRQFTLKYLDKRVSTLIHLPTKEAAGGGGVAMDI